jgi:pyridoxamine 5'-phosphate oxidase
MKDSSSNSGVQQNDPFASFHEWYDEMATNPAGETSAMILSTASSDGVVSSRVVLLKGVDKEGFIFYTNYSSRKSAQLASNRNASLLFYWPNQKRQVRIEGIVKKVSPDESDKYFVTRPIESRIGAWASEQSSEIESMKTVEDRFKRFSEKFGTNVPRPGHWGGFRLLPSMFEFWQDGEHRLHSRVVYRMDTNGWKKTLLAP